MLVDLFGRSIDYLRISLTDRCNLRCVYCMPDSGVEWFSPETSMSSDQILQVVRAAARLGISKIRLTGGEPLVFPGLLPLVREIAITPGINDLSLTTNATLLENMAEPLARAGLHRVNISLDTLDPEKFKRITRFGDFYRTWNGILAAEAAGLAPIKLNTVVVNGLNDDELVSLAQLTLEHPWHLRFIELMSVGNTADWGAEFPSESQRYLSVQQMKSTLSPLNLQPENAPIGNGPARTYRIPGARGTVGFISPLGEHFCQTCNRLRLTADGKLRACLFKSGEIDLRLPILESQPLDPFVQESVRRKPAGHELWLEDMGVEYNRLMSQIGG